MPSNRHSRSQRNFDINSRMTRQPHLKALEYLRLRKAHLPCWCDPRWAEVFQHAYGLKMHWLASWRGGRVVGALPLVEQRGLAGSRLVSLPWFDSAGIVADAPQAARDLHAGAKRLMHRLGVGELLLRHEEPLVDSHAIRTDKVTLRLELPSDPEELWAGLKAKVRNQVRKAEKADLALLTGGAELMRDFYAVYSRTMRDLGSPCHSLRFFRWVGRLFSDDLRITTVRLGSQPIAAGLTLRDRLATRIPWAGADWRHRKLNANMLMYWEILADACRSGAGCFDFGRSTRNAGTYKFKKQWGAEDVQLHWQSDFRRPGQSDPSGSPTDSSLMQKASSAWEKLPLPVANQLGPLLIRQLP